MAAHPRQLPPPGPHSSSIASDSEQAMSHQNKAWQELSTTSILSGHQSVAPFGATT